MEEVGDKFSFNSAYQAQTNRHIEVVNKILENLLRSLVTEHHN
jgi:hypothetical protein